MGTAKREHTPAFEAQVALAAIRGDRTLFQVAAQYHLHVNLVAHWRKRLLANASAAVTPTGQSAPPEDPRIPQLFERIGRPQVELAVVKKNPPADPALLRTWIDLRHPELSLREQCRLLGLNRSTLYYQPAPVDPPDLAVMAEIDRWHTAHPEFGSRKLSVVLSTPERPVNRKRVQRLMRVMGLGALYRRPKTTVPGRCHRVYPYLLGERTLSAPMQVWSADITYLPMPTGFLYLVATIDWFSRYVVAWRLSNTLDGWFCEEMLGEAFSVGRPEVFNTDQGVQFTASSRTTRLESRGVAVSMTGRGRCLGNVFVERLWRSVKYEYVYPWRPDTAVAMEAGVREYVRFYNHARIHQSLDYRTPAEVHQEGKQKTAGEGRRQKRGWCSPTYHTPKIGPNNGVHLTAWVQRNLRAVTTSTTRRAPTARSASVRR